MPPPPHFSSSGDNAAIQALVEEVVACVFQCEGRDSYVKMLMQLDGDTKVTLNPNCCPTNNTLNPYSIRY